ncbi:hypothetical protein HY091_02660 [Candidatus Kaiserbacteria bacterium]|nr:hypothetical protein [Candidatus Kaiserbacteria bacterium]
MAPFNDEMKAAFEAARAKAGKPAPEAIPESRAEAPSPAPPEAALPTESAVEVALAAPTPAPVAEVSPPTPSAAVEEPPKKTYSDPWRQPRVGLKLAEEEIQGGIEVAHGGIFPEDLHKEMRGILNEIRTAVGAGNQDAVKAGFRKLHTFGDHYIAQRAENRKNLIEPPQFTKHYLETGKEFERLQRALETAGYTPTDPSFLGALHASIEQLKYRNDRSDFADVWATLKEIRHQLQKKKEESREKRKPEPSRKQKSPRAGAPEVVPVQPFVPPPEQPQEEMVDESGIRAPQYDASRMQEGVDRAGFGETALAASAATAEPEILDLKLSEMIPEGPPMPEGTRLEWKKRLSDLIAGAKEGFKRHKSPEELAAFLTKSSDVWVERAKKLGAFADKHVVQKIEWYNKQHLLTKLALTGALVGGVALTSSAAPIVSGILYGALYGQRVVGGIGFAMNRRRAIDAKIAAGGRHWLQNASARDRNIYAAELAVAYSSVTMLLGHEAVVGLQALGAGEWLGNLLGHHSQPAEIPAAQAPHVLQTPFAAPLPEAAAPAAPEMPSVGASSGHGYEYMAKRLWEQLHDPSQHFDTTNVDPQSDLGRLLAADKSSVDALVHRLASDHGFYEQGSALNVRIDPSAHLTFVDGQLHFSDATHPDMVNAEPNAPTTPAYHPESVEAHAPPEPVPAPEHAAPQLEPLAPAEISPAHPEPPVPGHPEIRPNHFGLRIDDHVVGRFVDAAGNKILYGGSLVERGQAALDWAARDHSATLYFDSTKSGFLGLFKGPPEISQAFWDPATNSVQISTSVPNAPGEIFNPKLVEMHLPSAEDLAARVPNGN